jgi:hypothetical protein
VYYIPTISEKVEDNDKFLSFKVEKVLLDDKWLAQETLLMKNRVRIK